jgi:deoxyribodipyrimidine photo-lyase
MANHDNVSQLSPFIRTRLILEREVCEAILKNTTYSSVTKFIEEVCWRTYWKGWLEQHPTVWTSYLSAVESLPCKLTDSQKKFLDTILTSSTGIKEFDAWNDELVSTGYLHNHVRMWYASIWIFTLKLPWELGAQHFMKHLLDGDPASNTLSWRWVAGLHTPGKTYLAKAANIWKYTNEQFTSDRLSSNATPVSEPSKYQFYPLKHVASALEATTPCLSSSPAGLLVLPEDLSPEISELSECPFSSLCVLNADDVVAPLAPSEKVVRFYKDAIKDTAVRLSNERNGELVSVTGFLEPCVPKASPGFVGLKSKPRVYYGQVDDWVESVVNWAVKESLNSVRVFRPTVGPWQPKIEDLKYELADHGIRLFEYRRKWDSLHWPHAHKGYFHFKKSLEDRLSQCI